VLLKFMEIERGNNPSGHGFASKLHTFRSVI